METGNVHGGNSSVPFQYNNGTAPLSEVTANTANLPIGRDWTLGSPRTLVLWFHGFTGLNEAGTGFRRDLVFGDLPPRELLRAASRLR